MFILLDGDADGEKGGSVYFEIATLQCVLPYNITKNANGRFHYTKLSSKAVKYNVLHCVKIQYARCVKCKKIQAKKPKWQSEQIIMIAHFVYAYIILFLHSRILILKP